MREHGYTQNCAHSERASEQSVTGLSELRVQHAGRVPRYVYIQIQYATKHHLHPSIMKNQKQETRAAARGPHPQSVAAPAAARHVTCASNVCVRRPPRKGKSCAARTAEPAPGEPERVCGVGPSVDDRVAV